MNISFRKSVFQEVGGFHPLLASPRLGKIKMSGDETELCIRLLRGGRIIFFQPSAVVIHVIPERRLRQEYFLSLATGSGYLQIILDNEGQIGISTWGQLNRYGRRLYRRWKEYRRTPDAITEAERFWRRITLRTTWASVWYCLWAKYRLRRLLEHAMAEDAAARR